MAFLLPVVLLASTAATTTAMGGSPTVMPGCQGSCGGVDIPHPFGIGNGCFRQGFEIVCSSIVPGVEVPVLAPPATSGSSAIRVVNLTVAPSPEARVLLPVAWQCFNTTGYITGSSMGDVELNAQGVYRVSNNSNELYVLGCNTFVYAEGGQGGRFKYGYYAGCVSFTNASGDAQDGVCEGLGCCHVDIPPGITDFTMSMSSGGSWSHANQPFCPCDYAFIVENGAYSFVASDLTSSSELKNQTMPMVLDWAIRDNGSASVSCAQAINRDGYACLSARSECINSTNGPGYFCRCSQGSEGNPYILNGCTSNTRKFNKAIVGGGAAGGVVIVVGAMVAVFRCIRRNRSTAAQQGKEQHESFPNEETPTGEMTPHQGVGHEHLGEVEISTSGTDAQQREDEGQRLREVEISTGETAAQQRVEVLQEDCVLKRILAGEEYPRDLPLQLLKHITNNFSEKIGAGGFGEVYKGFLQNWSVAVKSIIVNENTIDDTLFQSELKSLLRIIDHPNVVRFLGFCANTHQELVMSTSNKSFLVQKRERLLCFEYISKGSLDKHITGESAGLHWDTRYQIIKGICNGLKYLHTEMEIIHLDLKPANIMLDDNMVPKITDFGLARLNGTSTTNGERFASRGYCAPEYLNVGTVTPKCDIYSLGVIIMELVTGQKGIQDEDSVHGRWRKRWGKPESLKSRQVIGCIKIAKKCMEKEPDKRFHDVSEIIKEVDIS